MAEIREGESPTVRATSAFVSPLRSSVSARCCRSRRSPARIGAVMRCAVVRVDPDWLGECFGELNGAQDRSVTKVTSPFKTVGVFVELRRRRDRNAGRKVAQSFFGSTRVLGGSGSGN